jgi:hypothetical protein
MAVGDHYYRFERFTLEQVFSWISAGQQRPLQMDGYIIDGIVTPRVLTYHRRGCTCQGCGVVATHFYAEACIDEPLLKWYFDPLNSPPPKAHLNLYGYNRAGHEFMMTSDHVVPKSLGGSNKVSNRVPLCADCNSMKGNDPTWLTDLPKSRKGNLIKRPNRQTPGVPNLKELAHA